MYGKSLALSQSTRKKISKLITIKDQSHFFLFSVQLSRKSYLIPFLDSFKKIVNQSSFRPSDSCEYQLLSIVHDIYPSFDCNPPKDVRGIFLDISKAFDRVWHEGIICKMKCIGIAGMPRIVVKLSSKQTPMSIAKWSMFIMGTSSCLCTIGFCIGSFVLFNLLK